jgi:hypothetical protein
MGDPTKIELFHPEVVVQDSQGRRLRNAKGRHNTLHEAKGFSFRIDAIASARSLESGLSDLGSSHSESSPFHEALAPLLDRSKGECIFLVHAPKFGDDGPSMETFECEKADHCSLFR